MAVEGRSIIFTGPAQVEVWDVTFDDPAPNEVVVRTEVSAISPGTERWILMGERPQDSNYPSIPGYQSLGIVEAVGSAVTKVAVGQRVLAGLTKAPREAGLSWGGHSGVSVLDENLAVPVPTRVSPQEAVFAWLAAVGLHGHNIVGTKRGDKIAMVGQGLIGQFTAQIARMKGCKIIASDANPRRVALSNAHSANRCVDATRESLHEAIWKEWKEGADIAFESTGFTQLVDEAILCLKARGKFVWQGWYPDNASFFFHTPHGRQITMHFPCSFGGVENLAQVLQWLDEKKLTVAPFITHVFSAEEATKGYDFLIRKDTNALGIVFDWR